MTADESRTPAIAGEEPVDEPAQGGEERAGDKVPGDEEPDDRTEREEREALDRLAAALGERQRQRARRWVWTAGLGLAAVATSPLLLRWAVPGPAGTLGRTGLPLLVWIGVAVMAVALAVALAWPHRDTVDDPLGVLAGAALAGIGVIDPLQAPGVGPAPWLALTGALVAASAAVSRIADVKRA